MLKIYNTYTKKKEIFTPNNPNMVKMYVCGVTTYDHCHIGHARLVITFDLIYKHLESLGYNVIYVRNITDIDDKIIFKSRKENIPWTELTNNMIRSMHEDFNYLNINKPTIEPKATDYIEKIIAFIKKLIEKKHAYVQEGNVYFEVKTYKNYGQLSKQNINELQSSTKIDTSETKKNPLDFALWKNFNEEPNWDSPWGKGRPGWHIECSCMAQDTLGNLDIHGGGADLIFPHHENEIAQFEAMTDKTFAKYWLHTGLVQVENEKMSKSLNNHYTIKQLEETYNSETIRLLMLTTHYRKPLFFTIQAVENAKNNLDKLYTAITNLNEFNNRDNEALESEYEKRFIAALNNDFNTPLALKILFEISKKINQIKNTHTIEAENLKEILKKLGNKLGILNYTAEEFFHYKPSIKHQHNASDIESIEKLIDERNQARKKQDWNRADQIRGLLQNKYKILLEDISADKTNWKNSE